MLALSRSGAFFGAGRAGNVLRAGSAGCSSSDVAADKAVSETSAAVPGSETGEPASSDAGRRCHSGFPRTTATAAGGAGIGAEVVSKNGMARSAGGSPAAKVRARAFAGGRAGGRGGRAERSSDGRGGRWSGRVGRVEESRRRREEESFLKRRSEEEDEEVDGDGACGEVGEEVTLSVALPRERRFTEKESPRMVTECGRGGGGEGCTRAVG